MKKIASNTIILYSSVVIIAIINLYTTRFLLGVLGSEDYGIYFLVAGLVSLLSFLNLAMTTSTLRFNAYYLGKEDRDLQSKVFNTSFILHVIMAIGIFIVLQIIGLPLINNVLNIPPDKIGVSREIMRFVILSIFFTIIGVPFESIINAHENMLLFSLISVIDAILKFVAVFFLFFINSDKLFWYSVLVSLVPLCTLLIKIAVCTRNYKEARLALSMYDRKIMKEIFSFSVWNLFGAMSNMLKSQGVAMIINVFYGVLLNTSYSIANQVNSVMTVLSSSLQKSTNPIIMKNEGAGNRDISLDYAIMQCRISILLLIVFAIPVIFNMPFILNLWLVNVPEYTIIFCRLLLVSTILLQFTTGIQVAIQSVGKIRNYQIAMAFLIFLNFPLSYILLKLGFPPYSVLFCAIALEFISIFVRVLFATKLTGMKLENYVKGIFKPILCIAIGSIISFILYTLIIHHSVINKLFLLISQIIVFIIVVYNVGLNDTEKNTIKLFVKR